MAVILPERKISRSTTYRPELLTAKGNPRTSAAIQKDVNSYAADFERKVRTGHYTEGHTLTFEEYSKKYLSEYAELSQAPGHCKAQNQLSHNSLQHSVTCL